MTPEDQAFRIAVLNLLGSCTDAELHALISEARDLTRRPGAGAPDGYPADWATGDPFAGNEPIVLRPGPARRPKTPPTADDAYPANWTR